METIGNYKQILSFLGAHFDGDALYEDVEKQEPMLIDGKPTVLVDKKQICDYEDSYMINPAIESISHSVAVPSSIRMLSTQMATVINQYLLELLTGERSLPELQRDMMDDNPDGVRLGLGVQERLKTLLGVSKTDAKHIRRVLSKVDDVILVKFYKVKASTEKQYIRKVTVTCPLYNALKDEDSTTVLGVKMSKRSRVALMSSLHTVIPELKWEDDVISFVSGSDDPSPSLHALIQAWEYLFTNIYSIAVVTKNSVLPEMEEVFKQYEVFKGKLSFMDKVQRTYRDVAKFFPMSEPRHAKKKVDGGTAANALSARPVAIKEPVVKSTPQRHQPTGNTQRQYPQQSEQVHQPNVVETQPAKSESVEELDRLQALFGAPSQSNHPAYGAPQPQPQVNNWGQPVHQQQPVNNWGQPMPQQQPQVNNWGQPMPQQPQQPVDSWGQPVHQQQPVNNWGQPMPQQQPQNSWGQQPQVDSWGQPIPQQPQVDSWGQPVSQQQQPQVQNGWGQPAKVW